MPGSYFHHITEHRFVNTPLDFVALRKGQHLFKTGEPVEYIYFLVKGRLDIIKNNCLIWQANPHEFIGITSFLSEEQTYTYTVTAAQPATLVKINAKDFEQHLQETDRLKVNLMKLINKRITMTIKKTLT